VDRRPRRSTGSGRSTGQVATTPLGVSMPLEQSRLLALARARRSAAGDARHGVVSPEQLSARRAGRLMSPRSS